MLLSLSQVSVWATVFLAVFLGPFAIQEMTGSFALGGLPFAMYYLANLFVVFPAGRLMDRVGRPPVLALGHATGAIGAAAVGFSLLGQEAGDIVAIVGFLVGLFLLSAGSSIAFLTRVPVADLYPQAQRARGVARVLLTSFAGSVLGATTFAILALSGAVPVALGYLMVIPFFALGCAAMAVLSLRSSGAPDAQPGPRRSVRTLLARPGVRWTIATNAGAQGGMGGVMAFSSAALMPLGSLPAGAVMLGHFGGMFLPSPLAGHLADRRSRALAILLGGAVLALGAVLFIRTDLAWIAGAGLFFVGAGWCLTFIPVTAILADSTGFLERGTLFGANDTVVSVFGGAMTILAGFLYTAWDVAGVAVLGVSCGLLAVAGGLAFERHRVARARVSAAASPGK